MRHPEPGQGRNLELCLRGESGCDGSFCLDTATLSLQGVSVTVFRSMENVFKQGWWPVLDKGAWGIHKRKENNDFFTKYILVCYYSCPNFPPFAPLYPTLPTSLYVLFLEKNSCQCLLIFNGASSLSHVGKLKTMTGERKTKCNYSIIADGKELCTKK